MLTVSFTVTFTSKMNRIYTDCTSMDTLERQGIACTIMIKDVFLHPSGITMIVGRSMDYFPQHVEDRVDR